jgi:DNA-binding IclR family transcriptional regulator
MIRPEALSVSALQPSEDPPEERGGIQVIARAAAILRVLGASPMSMSLGAIARAVDLPRSTVQRIAAALEAEGLVESGAGGLRLGAELPRLAAMLRPPLAQRGRPFLEALSRETGETVVVSRARGAEMAFVDRVVAEQELRFVPRANTAFPLSCTAGGKALLAEMTDEAVARLLGPVLPRLTPASPPDLPALFAELAEVRRTGLAHDRESHGPGVCAVATAIRPPEGEWTHAISIVVPTARFEPELPRLERALLACRDAMEAGLRAG